MDRMTKLTIKCKVMQYPHLRNKIADEIADVAEKGASSGVSGGYSSARNANGFDERLARIMSKEDYLWCKAVESSVNYFNERGREEIVNTVDELHWKSRLNADGVALKIHVSRRRVYDYLDTFYEIVHKFAIKSGVASIE